MAWKKPVAKLIACGMEINMYGPAEDERRSDELF
jgi:coenzyme PQQ precursor peptide PqqA